MVAVLLFSGDDQQSSLTPPPTIILLQLSCFLLLIKKENNNKAWNKKKKTSWETSLKDSLTAYNRAKTLRYDSKVTWIIRFVLHIRRCCLGGRSSCCREKDVKCCLYVAYHIQNQIMLLHAWRVEHVKRRNMGTRITASSVRQMTLVF